MLKDDPSKYSSNESQLNQPQPTKPEETVDGTKAPPIDGSEEQILRDTRLSWSEQFSSGHF